MSVAKSFLAIIQLLAFFIYLYSIYYQEIVKCKNAPVVFKTYGKLKFLTYWDLLLQFGFSTIIVLNNLLKIKSLERFIDTIFYSLALPVSLIVSSVFWLLYSIDRDLIFPKWLDECYPPWLNHSTHTFVAIFTLLELLLGQHKRPSNILGLTLLNTFLVSYTVWTLYIALKHNFWVYPFLSIMNWPQRIAFIMASIMFNSFFYYFGIWYSKRYESKIKSK